MEDYAAKMAGKTDAELHRYLTHRAEYREDAALAALTELERRGQPVPDAPALRIELVAAAQRAAAEAPAPVAPPWTRAAAEEDEEEQEVQGPELYTPGTIAVLSVVFFYWLGTVLLLLNFLRLRRYGGAALLMALFLVLLSLHIGLVLYFGLNPRYVGLFINAGAAVLYAYVLWPYLIGKIAFKPRSWLPPVLITFGVLVLLLVLAQASGVLLPALGQR